ncbi:MAG: hypothetical protein Tsb0032_00420 [Kiloniellaceae bacterium]
MTISTTVAKSRYAGDGATTDFPTGFKFVDNDHVRVILRGAGGGEALWAEGSEYQLSGAGAPGGGTVTVSSSPVDYTPAPGETLVIKLSIPPKQETSLPLGGAFPSTAVESMADLAALRDQQVEEALSRTLKFKESTPLADVEVPEPEAGKVLAVKDSGSELEWRLPQDAGVPSGGTAGQVLRKASGESYDAEWFTLGALAALNSVAAAQIGDAAVANEKLTQMAAATLKGRALGAGAGSPQDLTAAQVLAIVQAAAGSGSGLDADLLDGLEAVAFELLANKGLANGYAALDAGGKVPAAQLPDAVLGALQYQGTWNAAANAPALSGSGGGGSQGHYYRVSLAGATSLDGIADWNVGDYVVNNGAAWEKIDNTDQVVSVHGRQGVVVANTGDYTAAQVGFMPAGGLAATNLQAAVEELEGEKIGALAEDPNPQLGGNLDAQGNAITGVARNIRVVSGTSDTLVAADADRYLRCTNAAAVTITVPPNASVAFPVGTEVHVRQAGTGQVTVAEGVGVTVNSSETLALRKQHATITLLKVAADEWDLIGETEAA